MISVVLLKYQRPIERVVESLKRWPFVDDVVVWDNSVCNVGLAGRYEAAKNARHDTVYVQDDDCIVRNVDVLVERFEREPDRLSNAIKAEHVGWWAEWEGLLAWGAVFDRKWIGLMRPYIDRYGAETMFWQADRVFVGALPRPHNTILADIEEFECAFGPEAVHRQAGYGEQCHEARRRIEAMRAGGESCRQLA